MYTPTRADAHITLLSWVFWAYPRSTAPRQFDSLLHVKLSLPAGEPDPRDRQESCDEDDGPFCFERCQAPVHPERLVRSWVLPVIVYLYPSIENVEMGFGTHRRRDHLWWWNINDWRRGNKSVLWKLLYGDKLRLRRHTANTDYLDTRSSMCQRLRFAAWVPDECTVEVWRCLNRI